MDMSRPTHVMHIDYMPGDMLSVICTSGVSLADAATVRTTIRLTPGAGTIALNEDADSNLSFTVVPAHGVPCGELHHRLTATLQPQLAANITLLFGPLGSSGREWDIAVAVIPLDTAASAVLEEVTAQLIAAYTKYGMKNITQIGGLPGFTAFTYRSIVDQDAPPTNTPVALAACAEVGVNVAYKLQVQLPTPSTTVAFVQRVRTFVENL
jgi:hypothetical protein